MFRQITAVFLALQASPMAQQVLTSVTTPTFALLHGTKAVYQEFAGSKAAVTQIDINDKSRITLLPEQGAAPYYFDYFISSGQDLAYVSFGAAANYPLNYLNIQTKAKKTLSGDPGWKESVWTGGGFAVWVDYRHKTSGDKNGEIYLYDLQGSAEKRLTTSATYQAKPVTDGKHVAWLDYANPAYANVVLYEIASGSLTTPSASASHQDNARIDGDFLVWEDYRNAKSDTTNVDIFLYNLKTKETKGLCTQPQFQGKPFLQGAGVVWEDHRNVSGGDKNADIYGYDLANGKEAAVSARAGYESSPVLYLDRAVWFAIDGSVMNMYAGNLGFNGLPNSILPPSGGIPAVTGAGGRRFRMDGRRMNPSADRGSRVSPLRDYQIWQ